MSSCRISRARSGSSCNDYADIGGKTYIINYLDLAPELTKSLAAFREGVNATGAKTVPKE